MQFLIGFVCLLAAVVPAMSQDYGAPPPPPPEPQPVSPYPILLCPPPPPPPPPTPEEPPVGIITELLKFMDGINENANALVGKTLQDNIAELTQLIETVTITGDVCSVLRRSKQLAEDFWTLILNTISNLAWLLEKRLVAISILYENNLVLVLDQPAVQDDLRAIHGLLSKGQATVVPIVQAIAAEFNQIVARFDVQTRYLVAKSARSCPVWAQKQWVQLFQQTTAALVAVMQKYYAQTVPPAVATQNELKAIALRLLNAEVAAITHLFT